jgi:hypothetical protein
MKQLILEICTALVLCLATRAWKFKALFIDRPALKGVDADGRRRSFRVVHVGSCGFATFCREMFTLAVTMAVLGYPLYWWDKEAGRAACDFAALCLAAFMVATVVYEIRGEGRAKEEERKRLLDEQDAAKTLRDKLRSIDGGMSYGGGNELERFYRGWYKLLESVYEFNKKQDSFGEGPEGDIIVRYQAVYDERMRSDWLTATLTRAVVVIACMRFFA